ncbi:Soluble aldose sugar dehydrogenase YliI precursor [Aureliella helgolandensis]|uniref:Soluble aldose sugar dehydrogenase YliI n=1 Tax=Aureliella helgolandensis TaxID=2527968 RepID=A0A518G7C8_9BACT|nr:Soluble aldose sugar dehydrogenase YliI precursor [Aureliella helgolandensis]
MIESLLEPSRQIVEDFRTSNILTADGEVLSGIVKTQDAKQLTLIDAKGDSRHILRADIEDISISDISLMPAGLANELSLEEFADLIAYLESLRPGGDEARGAGIVGPISLPEDFEITTVATELDGAVALEVLPDGRLLICEQIGRVRVVEHGKLLAEPFVTLPVDAYWERGVIGVTHDPQFPAKPYIYVCWVAKDPYPHHHVSRFTMEGNVAVEGSEKLLLVGDDQSKMGGKVPAGHQGGGMHFGVDGKLYVSIGEQTSAPAAQELDTFLGKILRINSDGSIPEDNPFFQQAQGKYRAIWARGARNPFTFAIRQPDGLMLINDVGGESEEINVGRSGANFGWPAVDHGDQDAYKLPEFDGPIHFYPHSSINGAAFCPDDSHWPEYWRGRFFFADYIHGWIHTLDPESPANAEPFVQGMRRPVDLRFAPDGSLYVLLRNAWVIDSKYQSGTGSLLRIQIRDQSSQTNSGDASAEATSPRTSPLGANVVLTENAVDESAGNLAAFKIETPTATYFLEKTGAGLSSLLDRDGNDWIGFHPTEGSGAGGEYRGFPNAVYKQHGNYFHARNRQTDPMTTRVERVEKEYVAIVAESENGLWAGRYEFFPTHCSFAITKLPSDSHYWVLYEGTPGGKLDLDDWWMAADVETPQPITARHEGDLPATEWIAFGDAKTARTLVMLNHQDDAFPDTGYQMNQEMTVFGFGRKDLNAFHSRVGVPFSIGLVESTQHQAISEFAERTKSAPSNVSAADAAVHPPRDSIELGPKPGDVYREFSLFNGGNFDWRVTDPEATHEGAQDFLPNPVLSILVDDLKHAIRAEAVLERWGGHAGTTDQLIRFNGQEWIALPALTTTPAGKRPEDYHSQDNPVIAVPLEQIRNGNNVVEGMIGADNTGSWGQWGLYSVILRVYYDPIEKKHVSGEIVSPRSGDTLPENPVIELTHDANAERIDVLGWYDGYDEDGNGIYEEWHGTRFQPFRGEAADLRDHIGTLDASLGTDAELTWKTRWVPDQRPGAIKLMALVTSNDHLCYVTEIVEGLSLQRDGYSVVQYHATDVPESFSVRVGQRKSCGIPIPAEANLTSATAAVMHYRTWEAHDSHHSPFKLNGHEHLNQGKNHHYDYDLLPIPVAELKNGDNRFEIHSDTVHHMLEVLWPGPAVTVRYETAHTETAESAAHELLHAEVSF